MMTVASTTAERIAKVHVKGDVITGGADSVDLRAEVEMLLDSGYRLILVDLEVERMTSEGVGMLATALFTCTAAGARMAVFSSNTRLHAVFGVMGHMPQMYFRSEAEAMDALVPGWGDL